MSEHRKTLPGRPLIDFAGALFLLAWAVAGWISMGTNAQLAAFAPGGLDPGPAWMATIVLTLLTLGAVALGAHTFLRPGATDEVPSGGRSPSSHIQPAIFLASLTVYALAMPVIGFPAATALFAFVWIAYLSPQRRERPIRSIAAAAAGSAIITAVIYLGFVVAIRAPLP